MEQKAKSEKASDNGLRGLFNFETMYFPFFARVLYIVYCVFAAAFGLALIVMAVTAMFTKGVWLGLCGVGIAIVFAIAALVIGRVWLELVMVAFKTNEAVVDIRDMMRADRMERKL